MSVPGSWPKWVQAKMAGATNPPAEAKASLDLAEERVILPVLAQLCPASWQGLRRLSRTLCRALSDQLLHAALVQLPVLPAGEGLCRKLSGLADGAVVVLAKGRHRWSGKLTHTRRLRVFGVPGAVIVGRVALAAGSSGSFYDVGFVSTDGGAIRIQAAAWSLYRCSIACTDSDASALTLVSSEMVMHQCNVNTEVLRKACWVGLLVRGSAHAKLTDTQVGPYVQRGVVAVNEAECTMLGCRIDGCEEIGLRLDGSARVLLKDTYLSGAGVALQGSDASSTSGHLELRNCRITSFSSLWGGYYRPQHLVMMDNVIEDVGDVYGAPRCCEQDS
eukprot:CAMPEP_0178377208 /NCGR_PEP_ID=MMETSP0689_2-20121128/3802_1 /TAXON_ID=160604 /ORGANISM="Amphidinium massartii, Strain CS-259" /LENGTH=331 /DNA_ID=CAMNT_0019997259 /DNA_START=1 /DNA_END=993 /DNA_ORIENTATION=-